MSTTAESRPRARIDSRSIIRALAILMALYHAWLIVPPLPDHGFGAPALAALWNRLFPGPPTEYFFRGTHLLFALALAFLIFRRRSPTEEDLAALLPEERAATIARLKGPSPADWALCLLSALVIGYVFFNYDYLINRILYVDDLHPLDIVCGIVLVALVLEATRRLMGLALPITALVFLAYALLFARVEPQRLIDQLYMSTEGIFGQPLAVSASYVMIFVLFGAFMERTGTGQLFMDFAMSLTGHTAGGPGKVSVVSSSLFGTISGSAVANVMVDGPISIPLMKRTGFRAHFAAGVEAVASTGGQIMPPIMGAAAFVMAEFIGVGYGQIVVWALIPALLYYVACFGAVHFEAKRIGLRGVPRSELPVLSRVLAERGHLFLPVMTILAVMYAGYSAPLAALAGTLACFPVAMLRASTRASATFANLVDALVDGARNTLAVALACACAGIIIGVVTLTGLGITFTQWVVAIAQDTLLLALILTMIAGIVLGMGMPTTPAYIIMTALLVPAIVKLGVPKPSAHMFAFYFAILSAITPPVALAVYAAAGLAKSDLWRSGLAACKIGAAGFIVPFMFVYEPALLMLDPAQFGKSRDLVTAPWSAIAASAGTATVGCLLLAAGLHGYLLRASTLWQSVLLVAAALLLIKPGLETDLAGLVLTGIVVAVQLLANRRERAAAPSAALR
jgi:TRAP transporter 4TM/12TM fusion protein